MDQKINILIVEPGKEPRPATVEDTLEAFQQIVGGPIEAGCYLPQRVMLICNGEGKNMGLPPNRPKPVVSDNSFKWAYSAQQTQFQAYFALPASEGGSGK